MLAPLEIPDFPMVGLSGKRDNLMVFLETVTALLPRGILLRTDLEHDDGCPCLDGAGTPSCSCETVNLRVNQVRDPEATNPQMN